MSQVILRSSVENNKATNKTSPRRFSFKNLVSTAITVLLLGLTFTAGLGIMGTPESSVSTAYAKDCWGPGMDPNGEESVKHKIIGAWPGSLGNLSPARTSTGTSADITGAGGTPVDSSQLTAYEWYGTAGMTFYQGTWFDGTGCSVLVDGANYLGNFIQGVTVFMGEILLTVIAWGLNASYVQDLITGDDAIVTKIIEGFQDSLYLRWFLPLVTLAAAAIAYAGLVRKRGSEAIQGTIWVVVSAALALVFFMYPTQIAGFVDRTVISIGNEITSATARVPGASMSDNASEDLCSLEKISLDTISAGTAFDEEAATRARNQEMRVSQCVLWKTFIYQPWAASQFGPLVNSDLRVSDDAKASFRGNTTLPIVFLDTRVQNRNEVLSDEIDNERRKQQWEEFKEVMKSDAASSGWSNFSGVPAETRFGPILVGFFGLLFGLGPLTFLSFTLVVQQVLMLLLLLLAPIALTVGIFPGRGRKIMLGWLEMFLGTLIKRIIAYVLVAVLIAAMTAIMLSDSSGSNFLLQVGLVAAIGFGVLNIRKVIEKRFGTVNLGGDQGSFMQDNLNAVKQGALQTRGMITQPTKEFAKARGKGESVGKSLVKAAGGVREGAKTGGPTIRDAAKAAASAPKKRNDMRVQAEEEAMAKQRDVQAQRQARKTADQQRKGTAKLNANLAQLNENLAPRTRPDVAPMTGDATSAFIPDAAPAMTDEYETQDTAPVNNGYSDKISKLQLKEESLRSSIKAIEDSISSLDNAVASGRISEEEARSQKSGFTLQLMSLREDAQFVAIERTKLENNED